MCSGNGEYLQLIEVPKTGANQFLQVAGKSLRVGFGNLVGIFREPQYIGWSERNQGVAFAGDACGMH
jgi:hypothetical protein